MAGRTAGPRISAAWHACAHANRRLSMRTGVGARWSHGDGCQWPWQVWAAGLASDRPVPGQASKQGLPGMGWAMRRAGGGPARQAVALPATDAGAAGGCAPRTLTVKAMGTDWRRQGRTGVRARAQYRPPLRQLLAGARGSPVPSWMLIGCPSAKDVIAGGRAKSFHVQ